VTGFDQYHIAEAVLGLFQGHLPLKARPSLLRPPVGTLTPYKKQDPEFEANLD
jgi:hypothetical protein